MCLLNSPDLAGVFKLSISMSFFYPQCCYCVAKSCITILVQNKLQSKVGAAIRHFIHQSFVSNVSFVSSVSSLSSVSSVSSVISVTSDISAMAKSIKPLSPVSSQHGRDHSCGSCWSNI